MQDAVSLGTCIPRHSHNNADLKRVKAGSSSHSTMTFIQTKCLFLGLAFLLVGLEAAPQGRDIRPPTDRAPSVVFNYGCQCTNLIYRDEDGKVDGNCER